MASLLSHPALPVGLYLLNNRAASKRLLFFCCALSILPDADVIAFRFGIPYASQWGHRGFTHSIVFALAIGILCTLFSSWFQSSKRKVFWWTFLSTLSHPVMDALTNGGLGVAFFWPVDHDRYFFPFRPVAVSPIGILAFFGTWGLKVVISELIWIWVPLLSLSVLLRRLSRTIFP